MSESPSQKARALPLYTLEEPPGRPFESGELVYACAVGASNILKDLRENITNIFGGKMRRYEGLIDMTLDRAFDALADKAKAAGYDAVAGVRIASTSVTDGGSELVVYGTGIYFRGR